MDLLLEVGFASLDALQFILDFIALFFFCWWVFCQRSLHSKCLSSIVWSWRCARFHLINCIIWHERKWKASWGFCELILRNCSSQILFPCILLSYKRHMIFMSSAWLLRRSIFIWVFRYFMIGCHFAKTRCWAFALDNILRNFFNWWFYNRFFWLMLWLHIPRSLIKTSCVSSWFRYLWLS